MSGSCILTPCVTCYQQYKKLCPNAEPVFLLEKLLETDVFPFPDYHGIEMSIQDTCSARLDPKVLSVVRRLLERMNIRLSEPQKSFEMLRAEILRETACGRGGIPHGQTGWRDAL